MSPFVSVVVPETTYVPGDNVPLVVTMPEEDTNTDVPDVWLYVTVPVLLSVESVSVKAEEPTVETDPADGMVESPPPVT
jgi:hypothetical protein